MNKVFIGFLIGLFILICFLLIFTKIIKKENFTISGYPAYDIQENNAYIGNSNFAGVTGGCWSNNMGTSGPQCNFDYSINSVNNCMSVCNNNDPECTGGTYINLSSTGENGSGICYLQTGYGVGFTGSTTYSGWGSGSSNTVFGFQYFPLDISAVVGPTGPTGSIGPQGPIGYTGPAGPNGINYYDSSYSNTSINYSPTTTISPTTTDINSGNSSYTNNSTYANSIGNSIGNSASANNIGNSVGNSASANNYPYPTNGWNTTGTNYPYPNNGWNASGNNNWNNNASINYAIPQSTTSSATYNHYLGMSLPVVFYGPNGQTCQIIYQQNQYYVIVTQPNGHSDIYYVNQNETTNTTNLTLLTFYGQNGMYIRIVTNNNTYNVILTNNQNMEQIFYPTNVYLNNPSNYIQTNSTTPQNNWVYDPSDNSSCSNNNSSGSSSSGSSSSGSSSGSSGSSSSGNVNPNNNLYALKSTIVTPTCPVCQQNGSSKSSGFSGSFGSSGSNKYKNPKKCPPCPACARCPEPAYDCKKVPNYSAASDDYMLPVPVLNDFTTFGM